MKRRFTILTAAFMLLAFLAIPLGMLGQTTHTIGWGSASGEEGTYTNFTAASGEVADVLSFITQKNSSQTNPAYNANASELRLYFASNGNGGSITISPISGLTITDAVLTTSTSPSVAYYVDGGSAVSVSASNNTYTISGISASTSLKIQNVNTTNTQLRIKTIALTYTTGGTLPTTYTVTYHANVTGIDDVVDTYIEGATVTLRAANTFTNEGYTFEEWNTDANGDGDAYEAGYQIEGIDEDLEFYAIWTENVTPGGDEQWVLTSLADLTANDVFVIVGNNGSNYAMSNNNGTGSAPAAVAVTIANDAITGTVADNIQWTIGGEVDNYIFYPNGSTETWLYCTSSNNGVRVGTNNANTFKMESGYLVHQGTSRYVGIYNSQDWRCYTTINNNIQGQSFAFYKKVTGGVVLPSITAGNVEISYETTSGSIAYSINNEPDPAGTISAEVTDGDWLTLSDNFVSPIEFTCSANEAATARTATVTLSYAYGDSQTVTKDVTVTQAGNPNYTMTISEVREQGTGEVVTRGIVTSCVGTTGYIQDAAAAICVYGTALTVGDEIRVSGTLSTFHGLLEITNPEFTVISQGNTTEPEVMTIAAINEGANQGWYIRIEEATVTAISGQSTTIAQGDNTIVVYGISGIEIAVDDVISLNGNIGNHDGVQIANPQNVEVQEAAELTITPATVNIPQTGDVQGSFEVTTNITGVFGGYVYYYNPDDLETPIDEPEWFTINYDSEALTISYVSTLANETYEARTICFKYFAMCEQGLVPSNVVTVTQEGKPLPSITIDPLAYTFNADEHEGTIEVAYENVDTEAGLEIYWYEADGETSATYDWIVADFDDNNNVEYIIDANDGEARTAYFKVYGFDAELHDVWSGLVSISQEAPVIDYAELPFEFDGGRADIETTNGLTQEGLDSDYASSPKLKFNNTDDWVILKINERPGTLSFDIKGNGFSDGTFTVQTSEDGVTYTDLETYTSFGSSTESEEFTNLGENVRYIKWIYTEKVNGNVGLGNITLAKYVEPVLVPSITVDPDEVNEDADEHEGTLALTYENLEITDMGDFDIQYYDAEGEETETPDWIEVLVAEQDSEIGEGYVVSYYMIENEGEARSAYFKVYAMDDETNLVYSNLVTVNQEAYVVPVVEQQFALFGGDLVEGDYIIYYEGKAMNNVVSSGRLQYAEIEPEDNVITTDNAAIVWHIAPNDEGYWTIYSADANAYAASTGAKNKAQMLEDGTDDKAMWTVTEIDGTYEFVNKANENSNVNANLRNNSTYGFACYATATGGALSLYKYTETVATYTMEITGYGDSEGGYYLIASPVLAVTPTVDNGFLTDAFDLYYFDQSQEQEWRNYEAKHFNLVSGKGYLYASQENTTLTFTGAPYTGNGAVTLVKDDNAEFAGWNLVGNPFGEAAFIYNRNFYVMNETGDDIIASETANVNAMQGIFVIAENDGENIYFETGGGNVSGDPTIADPDDDGPGAPLGPWGKGISLNITHNTNAVIDRVIVRFGEGGQLPKFQLNENNTKVYIPQGAEDFAVVRSANQNEMPVNFKAKENGNYTISVNADDLSAAYLHLIDNMTGADIDLLQTPSYSFDANAGDNANRFRLVFNVNNAIDDNTVSSDASFAYFNGSEWVISNTGNATLQVVDMMGRVLSTETINGNTDVNLNQAAGVYMLRLVNGENVMVQKVVVR